MISDPCGEMIHSGAEMKLIPQTLKIACLQKGGFSMHLFS